jgi:hypothetical protein
MELPHLHDPNAGVGLFGSADIAQYLESAYALERAATRDRRREEMEA